MKQTIDNQILETIRSSLIENLEAKNKEAPESDRHFALGIQSILSQFVESNQQFDESEVEKLFQALSKMMELTEQANAQNNPYIRQQCNKIAMAFMYVAQKYSIESIDRLDDLGANLSALSAKALKYAEFALKIASDDQLLEQLQQIYKSQILHNQHVCQTAAPMRGETDHVINDETKAEADYSNLINSLQNPPRDGKPSEKSAKVLVWIIILGLGIMLGLAKIYS